MSEGMRINFLLILSHYPLNLYKCYFYTEFCYVGVKKHWSCDANCTILLCLLLHCFCKLPMTKTGQFNHSNTTYNSLYHFQLIPTLLRMLRCISDWACQCREPLYWSEIWRIALIRKSSLPGNKMNSVRFVHVLNRPFVTAHVSLRFLTIWERSETHALYKLNS